MVNEQIKSRGFHTILGTAIVYFPVYFHGRKER